MPLIPQQSAQQAANAQNPAPVNFSIPTSGLWRGSGDTQGDAVFKTNSDGTITQYNVGGPSGVSNLKSQYGLDFFSLPAFNQGDVFQAAGKAGYLTPNSQGTAYEKGLSYGNLSDLAQTIPHAGSTTMAMNTTPNPLASSQTMQLSQMAQSLQLAFNNGQNVQTTTDANGNITSSTMTPLSKGGVAAPPMTSIGSSVTPPTGGGSGGPTLPNPQGASTNATYLSGVAATMESQKTQLDTAYKTQIDNYQQKINALDSQQKDLTTLENAGMASAASITTQETADKQAALTLEKQQFQDNYDASQSLISEMDGLLTQGNQVIEDMQNTTGLASIMNPRISKTMSDITARTGVIQAVLAARSGQMGQAQNQLQSSLSAITSIATDQINYYKSLMDFYDSQKGDNATQLASLTKDQKTYVDAKIQSLQDNLTQTQQTAQMIQKAMLDPNTALLYAKAGVTLNDTVQQINAKLSVATYAGEISDTANKMAAAGYSSTPIPGVTPVTTVDSQGQQKNWYANTKPGTGSSSTSITEAGGHRLLIDKTDGHVIADLGPATGTGTVSGSIVSGKLTATQQDIDQGATALSASAKAGPQADGKYSDPTLYLNMYKHWVDQGGVGKDFLKYYPMSTYVNPANTWLSQSITDYNNSSTGLSAAIDAAFQ